MVNAIKEWLLTCPYIIGSNLYFELANASDNSDTFVTVTGNETNYTVYGGIKGNFNIAFVGYRNISNAPVQYNEENAENYNTVQRLLDWVIDQKKIKNYPKSADVQFVGINTATLTPYLSGVNTELNKAKYMFNISFEYKKGA